MKKLLNIFFVYRIEAENKWWHRLINVLIYSSTILVAIFAISIFVLNSEVWKKYSYPAFSFESNYASTKGEEVSCVTNNKPFYVYCGKNLIDSSDLISRHNKIIFDEIGADVIKKMCDDLDNNVQCLNLKYGHPDSPIDSTEFNNRLTQEQIKKFRNGLPPLPQTYLDGFLTDKQLSSIKSHDFDLYWDLKVKRDTQIVYSILLKNLLYVILVIFGWFVFWESIIYRLLLYIIFGKKRK